MKDIKNNKNLPIHSLAADNNLKDKLSKKSSKVSKMIDGSTDYTHVVDLDSQRIGNTEYTKRVVTALKEVLKENDELRNKVKSLADENVLLKLEIKDNYTAIEELGKVYQYCKDNHQSDEDEEN